MNNIEMPVAHTGVSANKSSFSPEVLEELIQKVESFNLPREFVALFPDIERESVDKYLFKDSYGIVRMKDMPQIKVEFYPSNINEDINSKSVVYVIPTSSDKPIKICYEENFNYGKI